MTIHKTIVQVSHDNIDIPLGFSAISLDSEHTLIWTSDHSSRDNPHDRNDLDALTSDMSTVDSHPNESDVGGKVIEADGSVSESF